jgi:hypothetical protein
MRPQSNTINPNIANYSIGFILLVVGVFLALLVSTGDSLVGIIAVSVPIILGFTIIVFINPYYGILAYINYSFFSNGLARYIPNVQLGLGVDFILALTTLSLLINIKWNDLVKLKQGVFFLTLLWFVYTVFLIVNPELGKIQSLFYGIRGMSLYSIQVIPLVLLYMDSKKDFNNFLRIIITWSLISTLWGLKQIIFGTDAYETRWLADGGNVTHVLNGQLRAFSFYSDAGQFGATMAFVSFITFILGFGPYSRRRRFTFLAIAFITFIGFSISGSRGPVFVIIFGFLFYLILIKRFATLIYGLVIGIVLFSFLKFTNIGSSNYQIFRIRTALDPKEASLMVRLKNQQLISNYLENKPFGAGVGTTDVFGIRFYPGSVLASLPTDSWFVSIWAQSGIVGLFLHLMGLAYVLVVGFEKIYKLQSNDLRVKMIAVYGGFIGIIIASLANPIFGQSPMGPIMYICMVYLTIADKLDIEFLADEKKQLALETNT